MQALLAVEPTDRFPVTHSVFSPQSVLRQIGRSYALGGPASCQLMVSGMNDTYLLKTEGDRYVVRVYRAGWRSATEIAYELELLEHLAAKGVSVSVPIEAGDGELMRPVAAPEGTRQLVVFTYAEGKPLSWTQEEDCYLAGRVAAEIHAASDDFVSEHARRCLDLEYLIDAPLEAIRPFLAHRPEDWRYLEGFAARLRARVEEAARAGLEWGVCHGDFSSTGNYRVVENRLPTVLDFDLSGPGWRSYDLAPIQRASVGHKNPSIWEAFLDGYTDTRPLGSEGLAVVPFFHASNHLWSMGMRALNTARWGALFMADWYLDWELAFLRNWEAEEEAGRALGV